MNPSTLEIEKELAKAGRRPRKLQAHREGVWLILMTLGLGVAAINTGHNLLYLILGFLLSLILVSGFLSEFVLRRATIEFDAPEGIFATELTRVIVNFRNEGPKGRIFSLRVLPLLGNEVADMVPAYAAFVEPGQQVKRILRLRFFRRGVHSLGLARLETDFPFALFTKSRLVNAPATFRIWPRVFPVQVSMPSAVHPDEKTKHPLAALSGDEFFGAREYRPGDPPHRIHWRLSARALRPMVREFQLPRSPAVMVHCTIPDLDDPVEEDRFADTAASVALAALQVGYAVGLQTKHAHIAPDRGDGHRNRLLDALAEEPAGGSGQSGTVSVMAVDAMGQALGEAVEIGPVHDEGGSSGP